MNNQQRPFSLPAKLALFCLLLGIFQTGRSQCVPNTPGSFAVSGSDWVANYGNWGLSSSNPINQPLQVLAGTSLELDGLTMYFNEFIGIQVQPGGQLTIRDCVIRPCDPDLSWRGIEVFGNAQLPGDDPGQGKFAALNSTFMNMFFGIGNGLGVSNGGWIYLKSCRIEDPVVDGLVIAAHDDASKVYIQDNIFTNSREAEINGYWPDLKYFATVINYCGHDIKGNHFENVYTPTPTYRGDSPRMSGMQISGSAFDLVDNTFEDLSRGVTISGTYNAYCPESRMQILDNTFLNNRTSLQIATGNNPTHPGAFISGNFFAVDEQMEVPSGYSGTREFYRTCITLNLADRTHIEGNTFYLFEPQGPLSIPYNYLAISNFRAHHCAIRKNLFSLSPTIDGTTIGSNVYQATHTALHLDQVDDILLECNSFQLSPSTNQEQIGLLLEDSPLIGGILGISGLPSENSFPQVLDGCATGTSREVELPSQSALFWPANFPFDNPDPNCSAPGGLFLLASSQDNPCASLSRHFDEYVNSPWKTAPVPAAPEAAPGSITVFPNPALSGPVSITLADWEGPVRIEAFGIDGRSLIQKDYPQAAGTLQVDLAGLSPGIYLLRASQPGRSASRRIVLQ